MRMFNFECDAMLRTRFARLVGAGLSIASVAHGRAADVETTTRPIDGDAEADQ